MPRATILGTLATAVVYMLSLVAVFGILPNSELATSTAPYSAAANEIFGGSWAGNIMAILVIISGLGALNGWTMICAEMPLAASKDGIFPDRFKQISGNGVPAFGIVVSTTLASVAALVNYIGSSGTSAFTTLVLMTGITAAIPYGCSALAQAKWRWIDNRAGSTAHFVRDLVIAVVALVFSVLFIWYSRDTGAGAGTFSYWAPYVYAGVALLLGVPVYRMQRRRMAAPPPVPAYSSA